MDPPQPPRTLEGNGQGVRVALCRHRVLYLRWGHIDRTSTMPVVCKQQTLSRSWSNITA